MTTFDTAARYKYVLLPPGAGEEMNIFGNEFSMKLSGDDTGGSLAMIEAVFPPGGNAPPHLHRTHTEAFYVISGESEMWYGEDLQEHLYARAGDFLFIPAGVPHLPANCSSTEPCIAVAARTDPNEQESVVLLPHLEARVPQPVF